MELVPSSSFVWSIEKLDFLTSEISFFTYVFHQHSCQVYQLLVMPMHTNYQKVIITHGLIMQEGIMYRQHVVRSIVMCDTYGNKLTVGVICALFYRCLDQFHYIIKRCLFHKKGTTCAIRIMISIIKCRTSNYNRQFIIILCLNLLNKSLS